MRPPQDTLPDLDEPAEPAPPLRPVKNGFRDEPTIPSETRTVRLGGEAPWLLGPPPVPAPPPKRDPLLLPVLVFAGILLVMIGYVLVARPGGRAQSHGYLSSP